MKHIPLPDQPRAKSNVAALIATYRDDFNVTLESAVHPGGATSDDDGPDEPVVSQRDLDNRRQDEYERGLDYDGRWAS